jgi:hypothetical protein
MGEKIIERVILTSDATFAELASPPATPSAGYGRIYRKSDGKVYSMGSDGIESPVGSGGAVDLVTQVAHGFVVADAGRPLYLNGAVYTLAKADLDATAEVVGLLSRRIDADKFEVTTAGEIAGLVAAVFQENALPAAGSPLFLSASAAGKLTVTEPSVIGQISKPCGYVSRSGGGTCDVYFVNMRGVVVGASNAETAIDLGNNTTTNVLDVSDRDSGTIEGMVYVNATTPLRARFRLPFVKNGAGVYQLSPDQAGTDSVATFLMTSAGVLQCVLANHPGFVSARFTYGMNPSQVGATFPLSIGESKLVPDGGAIGQFETLSNSANTALSTTSPRVGMLNNPTGPRVITLPPGVKKGYRYRLEVTGATEANYGAIYSPSGTEVDRIGGVGFIEVMALVDGANLLTDWEVIAVRERTGVITLTGTTGANTGNVSAIFERNGTAAIGNFSQVSAAAAAQVYIATTAIPTRFQNTIIAQMMPCALSNNGQYVAGYAFLFTSGTMSFRKYDTSNFTGQSGIGEGTSGYYSTCTWAIRKS